MEFLSVDSNSNVELDICGHDVGLCGRNVGLDLYARGGTFSEFSKFWLLSLLFSRKNTWKFEAFLYCERLVE